jgi:metallo-beta-lactamase class B
MSVLKSLICATALALACGAARAQSYDPPVHNLPPRVQEHVDLAYLTLDGDVSSHQLASVFSNIDPKVWLPQLALARKNPILPATRAFDQLYYLGINTVSAWALVTSDGIILIDTLDNPAEASKYIEGGLRSLKLDPARIKYIIITHGHPDHFGGAKYLAEKYHAHVLMSAQDWDFVARNAAARPNAAPPPTRDMVVTDGQKLTLGKTTVAMYVTPGHTPGPISTIFSVTDHGRPHVVSFFGGTGVQTIDKDPKKGGFAVMRNSLERFAKLSLDAGADAIVANHPFNDGGWDKARQVETRKTPGPSPWVVGKDAVLRFYVSFAEAVNAVEAHYEESPAAK